MFPLEGYISGGRDRREGRGHMEHNSHNRIRICLILVLIFTLVAAGGVSAAEKKALSYQDIMRFKEIHDPVISRDGVWVAYAVQSDRGDGEVIVVRLEDGKQIVVPRGSGPVFAKAGGWAAMAVRPPAKELEKAKKEPPQPGLALVNLSTGAVREFEKVRAFSFSDDSRWLALHHHKAEEKEQEVKPTEPKTAEAPTRKGSEKLEKAPDKLRTVGSTLLLLDLSAAEDVQIPHVLEFGFDPPSRFLAVATAESEGQGNGLFVFPLGMQERERKVILRRAMVHIPHLAWSESGSRLAFISAPMAADGQGDPDASLWIWDGEEDELAEAVNSGQAPAGWYLPEKNRLAWSKDGRRLFFGFKPEALRDPAAASSREEEETEIDLFDVTQILAEREVDVWHWEDPFINPHQKNMWPRFKDRTYSAVFHVESRRIVPLADLDMPEIQTNRNPAVAMGLLDAPYRKMITWYGRLNDLYLIDLQTGVRTEVATALEDRPSLSPGGRYVAYFQDRHWHLYDRDTQKTRTLTKELDVKFYDEDHDYPQAVPSYGTAGWVAGDRAVLIYDKYDIWKFPTGRGEAVNTTGGHGRLHGVTFRVLQLDPEREAFEADAPLLLSAYDNGDKHWGFYAGSVDGRAVKPLREESKKFRLIAKAREADVLLYTRESYREFPDLWVSDTSFASPRRISDVNPQIEQFAWGEAELVEWKSVDGIPLQGVLIKPGNYRPGKKYPVIVYFYRFFSQRLHEFNQTVINHRPNFPFYASHGYAVFLPDIRFEVGRPGFSATKCLVPGVQKLVDLGIADPDAIGLHGHSWSGYQTAFVVTQTDIFKCAVAGAPVSNMTSAYSGIRWGSGLARQFQYEQSQSRIGASLWERRDLYINNSPVFFADRINTPLLIIFGDEDGAVPWYQGIELYLAMRRLGKDCIFLQYRGEPHHPQKYPNKLDWFKKMKEYFDYHLKGMPGPDWITRGVPYRGK